MIDQVTKPLSENERLDWLRLIRSENVGPITFHRLLERFGSAERAIEALPDLAAKGGKRGYNVYAADDAARELDTASTNGIRYIATCEPDYPALLRAINDAPPLITIKGHAHLLNKPCVAIVGARNASANGRSFARKLASDLGEAKIGSNTLVVSSGLARGIDTAAHEGSLNSGTIAVVAGGIDRIYPPENAELMARIADQGVIIAEQRPGTEPRGRLFPLRNRIISGLALGVVVVEASPKSGSLITARMALEQGREVFAVPGAPGDPRTAGANSLIRDGAWLTENARDVITQLPSPDRLASGNQTSFDFNAIEQPAGDGQDIDDAREVVLELLGPSPVTVDEVARNCQVSLAHIAAALVELELAGRLERLSGNRVQLRIDT